MVHRNKDKRQKYTREEISSLQQMLQMTTAYMSEIQKDLSRKKKELEISNKQIHDSLNFSASLQSTVQASDALLSTYLNEYFVINKPKNIISGDHLWARFKDGKFYLACIDCTGHGIPGAMLSMAAHFSLNAVFEKKNYDRPSEFLEDLNTQFYNHLNTSQPKTSLLYQGLDIGLCVIDINAGKLFYCGTHQALIKTSDAQISVYKGNRSYIGTPEVDLRLEFEIEIKEGDKFFMFTDGLIDQFGGPNHKKILAKRIHHILKSTHQLNIAKQEEVIDSALIDWKGHCEQTDDILLIGFKI